MHGVVMGGGVGLSVHTPVRVGTEKTLFAMPETGIGLFPDVGAGHFLPRIKQPGLGMFLGLTGERLKGGNCHHAGVVNHMVPASKLEELETRLSKLPPGLSVEEVHEAVKQFETLEIGDFSLQDQLENIEKHFTGKETIHQLMQDLDGKNSRLSAVLRVSLPILAKHNRIPLMTRMILEADSEWSSKIAKKLRKMSPTSVAITFEQIKRGADLSISEVFKMEYRLGNFQAISILDG